LVAIRLVVRLAIIAASLAWAGFVVTHTIADPTRGERIAGAVLADDEARAEVVAPIAGAIIASNGLPPELNSFVTAEVDRVLRDPAGAQAFIDPFAGSWSRMLGEDDPRPTQFDLAPLIDVLVATTPGLDAAALPTDRLVVPAVPLPRSDVPGIGPARRAIAAATAPLALLALAGLMVGLVSGERRWAMRRFGLWAVLAGVAWVAIPAAVTWAARRWASGADAVIAVAVEEGISGLQPAAIALVLAGLATYAGSFLIPSTIGRSAAPPVPARIPAAPPRPRDVTSTLPTTARIPVTGPTSPPATARTAAMPTSGRHDDRPTDRRPATPTADGEPADGGDPLWDFYS
jgi:hypothetical protein